MSGTNVNQTTQFIPSGATSGTVSFSVINDRVALETLEVYLLTLSLLMNELDVVIGNTSLGLYPTTAIQITDDDSECPYYSMSN